MTVGQAFNESVAYYDEWIKTALPSYDSLPDTFSQDTEKHG